MGQNKWWEKTTKKLFWKGRFRTFFKNKLFSRAKFFNFSVYLFLGLKQKYQKVARSDLKAFPRKIFKNLFLSMAKRFTWKRRQFAPIFGQHFDLLLIAPPLGSFLQSGPMLKTFVGPGLTVRSIHLKKII